MVGTVAEARVATRFCARKLHVEMYATSSQSHSVFTTHASTGLQQESLTNWHWLIVIDALPLITRRAHWITVACCEPEELWFSKPTFLLFTRGDESICADNRGTA